MQSLRRLQVSLFDNIDPADINQGAWGNCWLVSSIAAMAEFPGALQAKSRASLGSICSPASKLPVRAAFGTYNFANAFLPCLELRGSA